MKPMTASRSRAKPLNKKAARSQSKWMKEQLLNINHHSSVWTSDGNTKLDMLEATIQALCVFPENTLIIPSGEVWTGRALPQSILNTSLDPSEVIYDGCKGNLLQFAIQMDRSASLITWMLASGFDPTQFNPDTRNSPIGQMAYTGRYQALAVCRQAGIDMTLRVEKHHYNNIDDKKPMTLVGSTLLHRVAERFDNLLNAREVMQELLLSGLDPYAQNAVGETPLDWASLNARHELDAWISKIEEAHLNETTPTVQGARHPKARL